MRTKKESLIIEYDKPLYKKVNMLRMKLGILKEQPEPWECLCQRISNNQLEGLSLHLNQLYKCPLHQWNMLWEAIQSSKIEFLDLDHNDLGESEHYEELWEILCEGIKGSNLTSLNLRANSLHKLNSKAWSDFSLAIRTIKLESLNLNYNFFYHLDSNEGEISPTWRAFCEAIKNCEIKSLILNEESFEKMTLPAFTLFCECLGDSNLKKLNIAISGENSLSEEGWLTFIHCLRKSKLNSLTLTYHCAQEFSSQVVTQFCAMLKESALNDIHLKHRFGDLSLTQEEWLHLAYALRERNITTFDVGTLKLEKKNIDGFLQGILASQVKAINLQENYLNTLPSSLWNSVASCLKEAGIEVLDLRGNYMSFATKETLNHFFNMISSSKIKSLYLTCEGFFYRLDKEDWQQFCSTIENSDLESLNVEFRRDTGDIHRYLEKWELFENSIKASRLTHLNLNFDGCWMNIHIKKRMTDLQNMINNRANYKDTLFGLCALTLFNQCKGKFSDNTLVYEDTQNQWEADLTKDIKDVMTQTWFKSI